MRFPIAGARHGPKDFTTMRSVIMRVAIAASLLSGAALAQMPGGPPPAVGVVKAQPTAIVETSDFIGRVQAVDRVALTARLTAFLDQRLFTEGAEVQQGDLLYRLERAPFETAVAQQEAALADVTARLANAETQLVRAQKLLATPAGLRSKFDDAQASQQSLSAQRAVALAQLQTAKIALSYTEIRAPVAGKIGRGSVTPGNAVSPTTGTLATIVSQDPMYVVFPVASRLLTALQKRYADKGGTGAVAVRVKLPDGAPYNQTGTIDYVDPSVSPTTDTVIANPPLRAAEPGKPVDRPLTDGAFVAVSVEGIQPVTALGIPRAAVLSDQQGDYVYVVGEGNKVEQRRIKLGQSTPAIAVVSDGLKEGETVIAEGIQKVRPGAVVAPTPVPPPAGK
jgi:membrane fusion protein (multidrug efflux system)